MRFNRVSLIVLMAVILVFLLVTLLRAEKTSPELSSRQLGEQVDVLQLVATLELDDNQIKVLASKATVLKQKREEFQKREEEILDSIKEPLRQMRDKLAAGQPIPSSISSVAEAKLKELQELRMGFQKELISAVGRRKPIDDRKADTHPNKKSGGAKEGCRNSFGRSNNFRG